MSRLLRKLSVPELPPMELLFTMEIVLTTSLPVCMAIVHQLCASIQTDHLLLSVWGQFVQVILGFISINSQSASE